ncbi:ferritin-like domain-containing protein [Thalassobacillus pellis]|uniref:ferritin-like domain-containing protein n=1 Tax=Thalassobacillus pellis TaxID=748008 RepID=UPI00195F6A96|nr:ferritin-like domain-containing protein [Thalassobacillus pellis]MBM7553658.1 rubrerythrin [Thalassobacillus pellis]
MYYPYYYPYYQNYQNYQYQYPQADRQNQQQLLQSITQAINGEYTAVQCYAKLIEQAPTDEEKRQIREIRRDEQKHLRQFSRIYTSLTGSKPDPQQIEECPGTYRRGLEAAFKDEQETADFYLDIADQASDPYIQQVFRRASADEQNHAVWFLYYLTRRR